MTCAVNTCTCVGVNVLFNAKKAKQEYRRYLRRGPHKMTGRLIEALKREDLNEKSMIDIGGGVGAIHHALLSAGVAKATNVDGSEAYIEKSKEEGVRLGHGDRLRHHFGDYVEHADALGQADIITLDKVICCYEDMRELVGKSSANVRKYYGVIYPVDRWWMHMLAKVGNVLVKFKSREFHIYIHNEGEIDSIIRKNGFKRKYYHKNIMWQVLLYER